MDKEINEKKNKEMTEEKRILSEQIIKLCSLMSVSGFEPREAEKVREMYADGFDKIITDPVGSHILIKRCGREGAPRIEVDTHFDEVGLMVTDVLEGGFLRVTNIGGIDPAIMQAADIVVYGKQTLRGVVASTPPHLRAGGNGKLPAIDELLVDMGLGYDTDELRELAPVGTPVGFAPVYSRMGSDFMAGKSFDNKACGAVAAYAVMNTPREELAGDVYLCFSSREETARPGGAHSASFRIKPHYALVADVNLGSAPDTPSRDTVDLRGDISISHSAATDRALTRMLIDICKEKEIAYVSVASPSSTGTNATTVNLVGAGIPVVDIGLPLRNMHTYNEVLCLEDCVALCRTVKEFITSRALADTFGKEIEL